MLCYTLLFSFFAAIHLLAIRTKRPSKSAYTVTWMATPQGFVKCDRECLSGLLLHTPLRLPSPGLLGLPILHCVAASLIAWFLHNASSMTSDRFQCVFLLARTCSITVASSMVTDGWILVVRTFASCLGSVGRYVFYRDDCLGVKCNVACLFFRVMSTVSSTKEFHLCSSVAYR